MNYLKMTGYIVRTASDNWTLGYEGENNARTLQIKTTDDLTDFATVNLLIDTLDCGAMTVTTVGNFKVLSMVLTSGMLGEAGKKTCQLLMMDSEGTVIKKSNQFYMVVGHSNVIEGTVPDSPVIIVITDYIDDAINERVGDEVLEGKINDWLDGHPEVTTTVQDGSITKAKFSNALKTGLFYVFDTVSDMTNAELSDGDKCRCMEYVSGDGTTSEYFVREKTNDDPDYNSDIAIILNNGLIAEKISSYAIGTIRKNTPLYGMYNDACTLNVSPTGHRAAVHGIDALSTRASYYSRDAVNLVSNIYGQDFSIVTGTNYTADSVQLSDLPSIIEVGMILDVYPSNATIGGGENNISNTNKYTGKITDIDVENRIVFVDFWCKYGDSSTGQIPTSDYSQVVVNPVTSIWSQNIITHLQEDSYASRSWVGEYDIYNRHPHGIAKGHQTTLMSGDAEWAYGVTTARSGGIMKIGFYDKSSKDSFVSDRPTDHAFFSKGTGATNAFTALANDNSTIRFNVNGNGFVTDFVKNPQRVSENEGTSHTLTTDSPDVFLLPGKSNDVVFPNSVPYNYFKYTFYMLNFGRAINFYSSNRIYARSDTDIFASNLINGDPSISKAVTLTPVFSEIKAVCVDSIWYIFR